MILEVLLMETQAFYQIEQKIWQLGHSPHIGVDKNRDLTKKRSEMISSGWEVRVKSGFRDKEARIFESMS